MLPPPTRGQVRERQCLLPARWGTGAWGRWLELIPRGSGCKVLGEPQGRGLRASPPAQPLVGGGLGPAATPSPRCGPSGRGLPHAGPSPHRETWGWGLPGLCPEGAGAGVGLRSPS